MTYAKADEFAGQPAVRAARNSSMPPFASRPKESTEPSSRRRRSIRSERRRKRNKYIAGAAASAAAAAATPIPFSDAALLVPIQLGMMAKIAQLYKIKFERAALMAIASTTAATQVGRATFTGLLKMVPGAGTVIGGAIGAGVASTFTYAMGQAWLTVCQRVAKGKLGQRRRCGRQRRAPRRRSWRSSASASSSGRKDSCAQHLRPITDLIDVTAARLISCGDAGDPATRTSTKLADKLTAARNSLPAMTIPDLAPLLEGEPPHDQVVFATRLQRYWPDLLAGLTGAYPDHAPEMANRLVEIAAQNFRRRPADLRLLDLRRHADPQWFQHQQMLGYATYADLFAGDLEGRGRPRSTTSPSSASPTCT